MRVSILFFLLTFMLSASDIEWAGSYSEAIELAKKENKGIYILITSETCRWCRKLESTTLKKDAVIDKIDKSFITLHVTRDKDEYPKYLKAKMIPMSYFIRPNGRVVHSVPGYWVSEDYLSIIGDAVRKLNKKKKK